MALVVTVVSSDDAVLVLDARNAALDPFSFARCTYYLRYSHIVGAKVRPLKVRFCLFFQFAKLCLDLGKGVLDLHFGTSVVGNCKRSVQHGNPRLQTPFTAAKSELSTGDLLF